MFLINQSLKFTAISLSLDHPHRKPDHTTMNPAGILPLDPFKELVDTLCCALTIPRYTFISPDTSVTPTSSPSPPIYAAGSMDSPPPNSGLVENCSCFLLKCSLTLQMQPHRFPTEHAKISFVLSLLTERALQWAETIWHQAAPAIQSIENLISHFREVFGHSEEGSSISEQLHNI